MDMINKQGRFIAFDESDRPVTHKNEILGFGDTRSEAKENAEKNLMDSDHDLSISVEPTKYAMERINESKIEPKS